MTFIVVFSEQRHKIKMAKDLEICGEPNPGFSLWTSAHGFHHYRSIKLKKCQCINIYSSFGIFNPICLACPCQADQRWRRVSDSILIIGIDSYIVAMCYLHICVVA